MGFFESSKWKSKPKSLTLPQCGKCKLAKKCFSPKMLPTGKGLKKILFVAEAPGEQEDRQGEQLIGDAGRILRKTLNEIKQELDDCWKTNAIICRPSKNKIEDLYIEACRPNLLSTIKQFNPKVIILLGSSAVKSLISIEWKKDIGPIRRWTGWNIPSQEYNAWICPTFHPSYILRMEEDITLKKIFKQHLNRAFTLEHKNVPKTPLEDLKKEIEIFTSPIKAKPRLRDLNNKKGILAFDYETTGIKPDHKDHRIISCSFCLNGKDTFACMIDESCHIILSKILKNPNLKKVGSNIKFEERWTRRKLGHPVENWYWDTMLTSHILDNRPQICSIKFQTYVHLGIPNYDESINHYLSSGNSEFNKIDQSDPKELLIYNGLDSLFEYKIMEIQRERMKI